MVSFSTAASALVLLTSTATAYELIAGYEPQSQVTDHNAIDLDQEEMEEQLDLDNDEGFENALAIYSEGAHSKSVATVTLDAPLGSDIEKGTEITGTGVDGSMVVGKAYGDTASGATEVLIKYLTSDIQSMYVGCQVGASQSPVTDGCFAESGTVNIDGVGDVAYSYDVNEDNINKRSIQGFSTAAQEKMYECDNCPYKTYEKFYDYYGEYDYANQMILAAFTSSETNFDNFNNDFGLYGFAGREQIIKKGTSYMSIWMYVIREMEDALDDCIEGCTIEGCNDDSVHAWDEGVAFYTGSLEGEDGAGSGKLVYNLADKRCSNFKTCGDMFDETTGTSHANIEIFEQFDIGQNNLKEGQCASAREQKEMIETMMLVPLIQGSLRYAYKCSTEEYSEKTEAEGLIFAASVLPVVAACDASAAQTIADNVKAGQMGSVDFAAVKSAFESTYDCMGINPAHIGGLYNSETGEYYEGAEPYEEDSESPCYDSVLNVDYGGTTDKNCGFVAASLEFCGVTDAKAHCPVTCNECSDWGCEDSTISWVYNDNSYTCDMFRSLPQSDIDFYCNDAGLYTTCRETCGICA